MSSLSATRRLGMRFFLTVVAVSSILLFALPVGQPLSAQRRTRMTPPETEFAPSGPLAQSDIAGPAGSGTFGTTVNVLPNGNIVVTDPTFSIPAGAASVGAVYLYNG